MKYPDAWGYIVMMFVCLTVNSDDANFLLATCYFRSGKPAQAYDLLQRKGAETPQSKFLMAKCCLELQK